MRFLLIMLLVSSCATPDVEGPKKITSLYQDCLHKDVGDWEDASHNFECISRIHHSVDSLLKQGNSPQALKLSKMGMVQYPFDDRIKNQFHTSQAVFKSVTKKMKDCPAVKERIKFLRSVSPDTTFEVEGCEVPAESDRVLVDDMNFLRGDRKLEMAEFQNISEKLKYAVKVNTENNFDQILFKGLESVDIIHRSTSFDVSDASNENDFSLKVSTEILMDQKIDETCQELAQEFYYKQGQPFECGVHKKVPLLLGKTDFENLTKLHEAKSLIYGFIPTNSIFVVEFHYETKKVTYYYFDNAFDDDHYPVFDEKTPKLEGTKIPNGYQYVFRHLNSSQVEGLKSITLSFNRLLTFEVNSQALKKKQSPQEIWREVVERFTISKKL